ncbi:MAG: cyclopropane fatty acyl phospholipid synthase [bacterium]
MNVEKENSQKKFIQGLLESVNVHIDGSRPWDIAVHNEGLYDRVLSRGSIGAGESYMDGWWDAPELDQFFFNILRGDISQKLSLNFATVSTILGAFISGYGSKRKAFNIGEKHYDIGNDIFNAMLDKRMVYTCGYWKDATNLDEAQEAKLDLVCRKIGLKKGQKVLDIGCGWGSFAKFAAEKYGATVVGVTVSKEQVELGNKLCAGLPVEIRLQDYRDVDEQFDHIVSLGMFEHVCAPNYKTYMKVVHRCLKDDGVFLLHTIGCDKQIASVDPWIEKYIFPEGMLPNESQIAEATKELFVMEDWHNFGPDYDKTLMAWWHNFDAHWPELREKYGDRFYRMWKYYILSCAGSFRARYIQLWQIVYTKKGTVGGYKPVR